MEEYDVERFIFPDGSEHDMIVFEQEAADRAAQDAADAADASPTTPPETHVCPVCHSSLVHPTDWQRIGTSAWRITLRCPNCETVRDVQLTREEVERFNRVLYEGTERLSREAEQLARVHFREESAKFVAALEQDFILPMDF